MKKVLYLCLTLLVLLLAVAMLIGMNLPVIGSYILEKTTGAKIEISSVKTGYRGGAVSVFLRGMKIKGKIEGKVQRLDLVLDITRGIYFKNISLTGFDLVLKGAEEKVSPFPFPVEGLNMREGSLTYASQRFTITEVAVQNLNMDKPFALRAEIHNGNWFDSLSLSVEGVYKGRDSDIMGRVHVTHADVHRLSSIMKGRTDLQGTFTYAKEVFRLDGLFDLSGYELRDKILKKPLFVEKGNGNLSVSYKEPAIDVKISGASFKNVPFDLDLRVVKDGLVLFGLKSGFFSFQDVRSYLNLDPIVKLPLDLINAVEEGKIKARSFLYREKKPLSAELELKDITIAYDGKSFGNVEGILRLDDRKMDLVNMSGTFRSSRLYNVEGFMPLSTERGGKLRGNYSVNLPDIPFMVSTGDLMFPAGTSEGFVEIDGTGSTGYRIQGKGKVADSEVSWRKTSASAKGSYGFTNDEITFEPLTLNRGGSHMVVTGKWNKKHVGVGLKGDLSIIDVKPFLTIPFDADGTIGLDIAVEKTEEVLRTSGTVSMDGLSMEIPGFMKKDRGMTSNANLAVTMKERNVDIESFLFTLGAIELSLKGTVRDYKKLDLDVVLDVEGIERVAKLFFVEEDAARGNVEVKLSLRDLILPVRKLPYMNGHVRINNGFLRLPRMARPLRQINLSADLKGDIFDIEVTRLVSGRTVLNKGTLHMEGLESPRFSLLLDMETFNLADFQDHRTFVIPAIDEQSILARAKGDIVLRAKRGDLIDVQGDNLEAKVSLSERVLNVSELKGQVFGGEADIRGRIDLSVIPPQISASARLSQVAAGLLLKSIGAKSEITDGKTNVNADLKSAGWTLRELAGPLEGEAVFYSRDGVIKRWNLLSKIFSLLNIYDLFRGRIDLSQQGLPYKKMGASFTIKDGILHTGNFLIDSQSMLITGDGTLDIGRNMVSGNIAVSPLVALDTAIGKIPILRNILTDEGKGFFYAAYKVSGPMDDPDISVSFINSIAGKTLEILRNILVLPVEIFGQ